jgi:hypothetical protein
MKWEVISDATEWNQFVQTAKHATPFHVWEWGHVISEAPDAPTYLGCRDASGLLVAGCPFLSVPKGGGFRMLDSRKYTDLWGPIFRGDSEANGPTLASLKPSLGGPLRHRIILARLKTDSPVLAEYLTRFGAECSKESGYFVLHLEKRSLDRIWEETLGYRYRRIVNYFERIGADIRVSSDESEFLFFLQLNRETMRAQGHRVHPVSFFQNIRKYMGRFFMTLNVFVDNRCVGTIGFFTDAETGSVYASYSGYERRFPRSPFFFACWGLINWSFRNGFKSLNLGNTSSNPTHPSYLLKESLGGEFVQQYTFSLPTSNFLYSSARYFKHIFRR